MRLVELLIEYASHCLDRPFTYFYTGTKNVETGFRVLVPFNNQKLFGYVTKVYDTEKSVEELEDDMGFTLLEIIDVIDEHPLLNDELLKVAEEISKFYLAPKISVLQTMLPPSLSPKKSSSRGPKIAYDQFVVLKEYNEDDLTHKQIELLRLIYLEKRVNKRDIKSPSVLSKLVELGRVEIVKEEKRRYKLPDYKPEIIKSLTVNQKQVINEFINSNDSIYLLEGVTGSGKTEVYLSLSEYYLNQGKQVLMLVPEISLTPMMMEYFAKRFKNKVAILHSELTPGEKYDEYRKIAKQECSVVIGARSAIFAPLSNIGLIILDEEHVESYKQDVMPFYHAREVAIMRSKINGCKVLMGSATPSLESKARADKGIYHLLKLPSRINNKSLPNTSIINMLDMKNIDRDSYMFSKQLRNSIATTLSKHEQAILLLNRRGFSTNVSCRNCGYVFKCPNCGVALTYHKSDGMLKCHHCDHVESLPETCPECGSKYLMKTGFGCERVEEEVRRLFPEAKVLRLDSDSAKVRTRITKTIEAFSNHEADILVGTQMIAKGHDFPLVSLVGIVLADIGLNMPNYRCSERTFQLITQAVGRSGRKDLEGKAIIQTYMPDHYAITLAARQDYELFYKKEMAMRSIQHYPPYQYLALVSIVSKSESNAEEGALKVSSYLSSEFKEKGIVIGPSAPFISFQNSNYIQNILVKYRDVDFANCILSKSIKLFTGKHGINILVNIDPYIF